MRVTSPFRGATSSLLCLSLIAAGCQTNERSGDLRRPAGALESAEQPFLVRARALHERLVTIDSHSDFRPESCGATDLQVDVPKMRAGGLDAVFEIVFTAQPKRTHDNREEARRRAMEQFQAIRDGVRRCGDDVELARTPEDLERIVASGRLSVAIGIENGFPIGEDLALLETYRDLGAAYVGLTHEGNNDLADSANPSDELGDVASEHGGVSELGRRVIAEMNRLGIMVDVSHLSRDATRDAIRLSRAPVIASHSSIFSIKPDPRNIDDETLLALAAKGGVLQITPVHSFIKVDPPGVMEAYMALLDEFGLVGGDEAGELPPERRAEFDARLAEQAKHSALATVVHFVDHIDYAVGLVGVDHVGIGSDFNGSGGMGGVTGWSDASETVNVTAELLRRGYTEEEIRKIWGGNLLRVWREVRRLTGGGGSNDHGNGQGRDLSDGKASVDHSGPAVTRGGRVR